MVVSIACDCKRLRQQETHYNVPRKAIVGWSFLIWNTHKTDTPRGFACSYLGSNGPTEMSLSMTDNLSNRLQVWLQGTLQHSNTTSGLKSDPRINVLIMSTLHEWRYTADTQQIHSRTFANNLIQKIHQNKTLCNTISHKHRARGPSKGWGKL